ncbi:MULTISPECIES: DUF6998 domain-containing protein [unclassified Pseudoalteromonas]|uniref:DUF6998 domain-containing protein n=1 Tax=unclassified Pseudoalteromonas TaxID=194690 RepID=UPI001603B9B2|nr:MULTISPECIES: hypothetical protein [unclassified Pseudoalteromonas]MBB1350961.1 hypothetical protein [Pseudoalteromonas sp. SG45-3]MBB1359499.1 hypothetical protein [Pseudoalteromonas sp. SG45-6]
MALTQMQIIQSLGEAMSWLERELSWDVPATELRHLTGRIGELYAALITNGRMATEVNQAGYDVVSSTGERISVKTTGRMHTGGHISFNTNTLELVDRIIILRINTDEMQVETLLDMPVEQARLLMSDAATGKSCITMSKLINPPVKPRVLLNVKEATWNNYKLVELESGTIEVFLNDELVTPSKRYLRDIAKELGVSILNGNGNPFNTRQLGSVLIKELLN